VPYRGYFICSQFHESKSKDEEIHIKNLNITPTLIGASPASAAPLEAFKKSRMGQATMSRWSKPFDA
jgi:hypothetical protein